MDGVQAVPALRSEPARLRAAGTADQVGGIKRHTRCASSSEGVRTALLFRRTSLVRGVADARDHTCAGGNVPLRSPAAVVCAGALRARGGAYMSHRWWPW